MAKSGIFLIATNTPQNGIDQGYHPTHGLGVEAPKDFLEFPKKSRPGL
jgi:hypothetical protein